MASRCLVYSLLLFALGGYDLVSAGEYCNTGSYTNINIEYCNHGCCGTYPDAYCCVPVGSIVGGIIGCLFFIGIIVAIVACCKKHNRSPGVVVQPNTGPAVIMSTQQHHHVVQPGFSGGPQYPGAYPSNSQGQQMQPGYPPQAFQGQHMPPPYPGNVPEKQQQY